MQKAPSSMPVLDKEILENLLALDNFLGVFLNELIDIYNDTAPAALDKLVDLLETGTDHDIARQAHKVKGMVGNLGAIRLTTELEHIELSIGTLSRAERESVIPTLRAELTASVRALNETWHSVNKIAG